MRTGARVMAAVLGAMSGLLPTTGTAAQATAPSVPAVSVSVVTPAQAASIVKAYLRANNAANAHFNRALQDRHEAGSAAVIDDAYFRIAVKVGLPPVAPFQASGLKVYVPRQPRYPALFVAYYHAKFSGKPAARDTSVALFQRRSARDTWRVISEPTIPAGFEVPKFVVGPDGYLPTLAGTTLAYSPTRLNKLWIAAQTADAAGKPIAAVWARTALLKTFGQSTSPLNAATRRVVSERDTFKSSPFAPVCVASRRGALCFVSTTFRSAVTVPPALRATGYRLWILSSSDQYYSGGLPLGRNYVALTVASQREAAIEVPRAGSPGGLRLLAQNFGRLSGTGTRG
ncbi:MAG: hypothetical protein QOJ11_831 [Frankiales bacterium]|jgi:hypothetical protein|nr:hypothetical protein [Frankiales bacterium]